MSQSASPFSKIFNQKFASDFVAGLTTSFAALALGAAFGVQSGRGAFAGMLSAAIIPIITSIFGGTRLQASGPTAPMTAVSSVIVASAYDSFGSGSVQAEKFITLVFLMMAGWLALAGITRLGNLINWVPQMVIIGFMNGIALLVWWDQLKKLFGLNGVSQLQGPLQANLFFAISTFILILIFPFLLKKLNIPDKFRPFIPGTLIVILALTEIFILTNLKLSTVKLGSGVSNIFELFTLIPKFIPDSSVLTLDLFLKALPFSLQLAFLAYLDSLLTSLAVDQATKEKTKKNKELMAQGLSNGVAAVFGGIPGAQATIRSFLLLKEGAQTRLAGVLVGVFTILGIFLFKDFLGMVATSIFIGVLFKAGLDVFEKAYVTNFFKNKNYQDQEKLIQFAIVALTTTLTVIIDLNIAVLVGTTLFYILKHTRQLNDISSLEESTLASSED